MTDFLHLRAVNDAAVPVTRDQLDDELNRLSVLIDKHGARDPALCAAYRALRWARDPAGHAPPSA